MSADCIILLNSAAIFAPCRPARLVRRCFARQAGRFFRFFIVSVPAPSSFLFQLAMVGEFLFHLFQLLTHRFTLLLFSVSLVYSLKAAVITSTSLALKRQGILFCPPAPPFQAVINAILPGHPVERLDIIVRDNDVRDLRAALLQALDALPTCFLTLAFSPFPAASSYLSLPAALSGLLSKFVQ